MASLSFASNRMKALLVLTGITFGLNHLQAQYAQDYSIRRKPTHIQAIWNSDRFNDSATIEKSHNSATAVYNRYDMALRSDAPILLTTYSPSQYAAMPGNIVADKKSDEERMDIRSRKGTVLLSLHPSQLITIQSLLQGKIHNKEFFSSFIMDQSADQGSIEMNRELLRQLLALHFSRQIPNNKLLNDFRLEYGKWLVSQKTDPSSASETKHMQPCGSAELATAVYSWKIPAGLEALLGEDNTIAALNDLAVEVLAGKKLLAKNELADLGTTIRIVNEAFEEGRFLLGWSQQFITCSNSWILRWKMLTPTRDLPISADAYSTQTTVQVSEPETQLFVKALSSSRVLIELYTEKGSRVEKFYHSNLEAGETQRFTIKNSTKAERLVYKVTADGRTYSGLIP